MTFKRRAWMVAGLVVLLAQWRPYAGAISGKPSRKDGGALNVIPSLKPFMPRPQDFTLMWWANGPQQYLGMKQPPPEPVLCLQSGTIGLAIDTSRLRLLHSGKFAKALDMQAALRQGNSALFALPPARLEIGLVRDGRKLTCARSAVLPKDAFYFPVRFVESGRFFQRVAIEGLEFIDDAGQISEMKGRLEIAFWPDHAVLSVELDKGFADQDGAIFIEVSGQRSSSPLNAGRPAVLELFPSNAGRSAEVRTDGTLKVNESQQVGCTVLNIPTHAWKNAKGTYYPEEELDRLDRWNFTVRNDHPSEAVARLMFVDEHPPAITGFTPLLCDTDGSPTGIPVQISKNWHRREEKGELPHQGPWFHGCTFVRLPAHSQREFVLTVAYARYGGVPAASHAQLCLIGWGHNQFWEQAAIGSFGESICYEPGRVQRRCFIDDVRPLMTLPDSAAKPYGWAGNCGGGDFLVWIDTAGQYQGFRNTRTDYRAYGPCLTDVCYVEETAGGEIASRVNVSIARSDDYLRAFHRLRYDVRQPVKWKRLAFYQLGADYYNATGARRVAVGDATGLNAEWEPIRGKDVYDRRGVPLSGKLPWISIHGMERGAVKQGEALASRGLIVRSWKAVLGGKVCSVPHASFYATEWGKGNFRTTIELSPPLEMDALKPGDFVDAEIELVVFPSDAQAYYGPNENFRKALKKDADTWGLVHRETSDNPVSVKVEKGRLERILPLHITANNQGRAVFSFSGGIGYVPVTFSGLSDYREVELLVNGQSLQQRVHGNDFWQTDYDEVRQQWSVTYNILKNGEGSTRLEFQSRRRH